MVEDYKVIKQIVIAYESGWRLIHWISEREGERERER